MKKVLSIVLAISMIMSLIVCVPVSADTLPGNIATDYAPDYDVSKYTGNFVNTPWTPAINGNRHNVGGSGYEVYTGTSRGEGWVEFMAMRDVGNPLANANGELNYQGTPLSGTNVSFTKPASGTNGNVVFSFDVTIDSDNPAYGVQMVQIARRLNGGAGEKGQEYPVEYPGVDKGFVLTKDKIEKFQGTFAKVEGVNGANYGAYSVGLPMGSLKGARFEIRGENAYIGYEYAYDMEVVADVTASFPGGSFEVDANILNQIGKDGDFDDSVTWYVTNADRTAAAEGFTVVEGENGKAKIYADTTVAEGTYVAVAVSDNNADFVKGIEFEIGANPYSDYVPGEKTGNLIPADWVPSMNYNQHNSSGSGSEVGVDWIAADEGYRIMATRTLGHPRAIYSNYVATGEYNYHGASLSGSPVGYTAPAQATTGNVVFSFQVKTNSSNPDYGTQKIQIGRRHYSFDQTDSRCNEYSVEYPGADGGFPVTTSYQTFSGTFVQPAGMSSADIKGYSIGLPMGTLASARVFVKSEGAYLGYEYAYDLEVSAAAETVAQGETVAVEATVLNQIGKEYAGAKETITWKAMNTARTAFVDGITVVDGVATVADTVAPGTYDIVAIYGDKLMAKGVSIEVTEAESVPVIEGITIEATENGITVATDTALTDAQLIFVTYESGKMAAVNNATKVTLDAQGTQEYSIPSGFANAKVMLFTADYKPLANVLN